MNGLFMMLLGSWTVAAGLCACAFLLVLVGLMFKKLYHLDHEIKLKEQFLKNLETELHRKEDFQSLAFRSIINSEISEDQLLNLFNELCPALKATRGVMVIQDPSQRFFFNHSWPEGSIDPVSVMNHLQQLFCPDGSLSTVSFIQNPAGIENCVTEPLMPGNIASVAVPIIGPAKTLVGGMYFFPDSSGKILPPEGDFIRAAELINSLLSLRKIQDEITSQIKASQAAIQFLKAGSTGQAKEKFFDLLYQFLRDMTPQANLGLLMKDPNDVYVTARGQVMDEHLSRRLISIFEPEFFHDKPYVYLKDPEAISFLLREEKPPAGVASTLQVPIFTNGMITGYAIWESVENHPFSNEILISLIQVIQVASNILDKLRLQEEITRKEQEITRLKYDKSGLTKALDERELTLRKKEQDISKLRQERSRLAIQAEELALTNRELSNFNTVFSLVQSVKSNLATLRGFLSLIEENMKKFSPSGYDPVFFRNSFVEVEKIDKSIQKFELVRIVTDPDFLFRPRETNSADFLNAVFVAIRSRAMIKKIEIDNKWEAENTRLFVDQEITALSMIQFLDRMLDLIACGKLESQCIQCEDELKLEIKYIPTGAPPAQQSTNLFSDFQKDFNYMLMLRVLTRQGGNLDCEIDNSQVLIFHLSFPSKERI